jgi:ribosome-binding factor A
MSREFGRHLRVGAELQRLINELLLSEVKDPRLSHVRVSEVDLSGDLGVAKVYYSLLDPDEDAAPAKAALERAAGFLRGRVGRALRLRRVPELRFLLDHSARRGAEISELISGTRQGGDTEKSGD